MPTLDLPPRPVPVLVAECEDDWGFGPAPQGQEGQQLEIAAAEARRHLDERAERLIIGEDADASDYVSVPLKPSHTVKVRYKYVGELRPLPYPLDE